MLPLVSLIICDVGLYIKVFVFKKSPTQLILLGNEFLWGFSVRMVIAKS